VGPDSVGVANFSCSLRVRIYKVRARSQFGAFLTYNQIKESKKENGARTRKFWNVVLRVMF